jgi:hypothetical protein
MAVQQCRNGEMLILGQLLDEGHQGRRKNHHWLPIFLLRFLFFGFFFEKQINDVYSLCVIPERRGSKKDSAMLTFLSL